jgi:hypothetical protein
VAQFGRGALADVSEKLLKQFVTNLESTVLTNGAGAVVAGNGPATAGDAPEGVGGDAPATAPAASATSAAPTASSTVTAEAPTAGFRKIESAPVEPIDLLDAAGVPLIKRLLPIIGGAVVLLLVWRILRRRG